MDIERRLQNLEDEIKILKNQIQNTLLDIQEQITMYSSSELADDRAALALIEKSQTVQPSHPAPAVPLSAPASSVASAVSQHTVALPASGPAPLIKRVSLQSLETEQKQEPEAALPRPDVSGAKDLDMATFMRLVKWESVSAVKCGVTAVRRALDATVNAGHLPGGVYANLIELLPGDNQPMEAELSEFLDIFVELNAILEREPNLKEALALLEAQNRG